MEDSPVTQDRLVLGSIAAIFFSMAILAAWDLWNDLKEGVAVEHVLVEGSFIFIGLGGAAFVTRHWLRARREHQETVDAARALAERLEATAQEAQRWRKEAETHLQGLGEAIDQQMERWQLSGAEKEVALLLLKGLSHKEIAAARSVSEATARQQARAVYRKADLSGRNDLSAFFLEDLFLPVDRRH